MSKFVKLYFAPFTIISTITQISALISFFQGIFDYQFNDLVNQYVAYYRTIVGFLFDWILWPFGWKFPNWYKDVMLFSGITAAIIIRTDSIASISAGTPVLQRGHGRWGEIRYIVMRALVPPLIIFTIIEVAIGMILTSTGYTFGANFVKRFLSFLLVNVAIYVFVTCVAFIFGGQQ